MTRYVLCLNDNFNRNIKGYKPSFGEIYEVEVDMGKMYELKGFAELFPSTNFEDITDGMNELTDILLDNNLKFEQ